MDRQSLWELNFPHLRTDWKVGLVTKTEWREAVYDKDHTSELRIKNRSERDLCSCEVTWAVTSSFSGLYFITAKISYTSMTTERLKMIYIEKKNGFRPIRDWDFKNYDSGISKNSFDAGSIVLKRIIALSFIFLVKMKSTITSSRQYFLTSTSHFPACLASVQFIVWWKF